MRVVEEVAAVGSLADACNGSAGSSCCIAYTCWISCGRGMQLESYCFNELRVSCSMFAADTLLQLSAISYAPLAAYVNT